MKLKITMSSGEVWELEGTAEELAKLTGLRTAPTVLPRPFALPPVSIPSVWVLDPCPLGGAHEYPEVWCSVSPAPCKKCGKASTQWVTPTWTYYDIPNGNHPGLPGSITISYGDPSLSP